jgi:hypothetical protein
LIVAAGADRRPARPPWRRLTKIAKIIEQSPEAATDVDIRAGFPG